MPPMPYIHASLAGSLTPEVVEEALSTPTVFIVTYHTPIFSPLKSFTLATPLQRSLLRCAAAGISVYSPHSALDSVTDGINDWLCTKVAGPLRDITWTSRFIGQEFPDGLGGVGRVVTLKDPVDLQSLAARLRNDLELKEGASRDPHRGEKSSAELCEVNSSCSVRQA